MAPLQLVVINDQIDQRYLDHVHTDVFAVLEE
jgi:hypothetical protein